MKSEELSSEWNVWGRKTQNNSKQSREGRKVAGINGTEMPKDPGECLHEPQTGAGKVGGARRVVYGFADSSGRWEEGVLLTRDTEKKKRRVRVQKSRVSDERNGARGESTWLLWSYIRHNNESND